MKDFCVKYIATLFGVGLFPFAPGTIASIVTLVPFCFFTFPIFLLSPLTLFVFLVGTWASGAYSAKIGISDPKSIVIDETVGIMVAFLLSGQSVTWRLFNCFKRLSVHSCLYDKLDSYGLLPYHLTYCFLIFSFFRLFDIFKPFPVSYFDQKVHGGIGIMMDDVVAGVMTAISIWAIVFLSETFI